VDISVSVTGVSATGEIGSVSSKVDNSVSVTGVSGTAEVGRVFVWSKITPSQSSKFSAITPSQTLSWTDIAA
jgi:hypothetical protein